MPAGFADGVDDNTTYTAGAGLTLTGTQLSIYPTYRLPQGCNTTDTLARWDDATETWLCSQDAGDITGIIAGEGLTGTAFSGEVTIDAYFDGTGSAERIARSDHNHWAAVWTSSTGAGTGLDLSGGTNGIHVDGSLADLDLGGIAGTIRANDDASSDLNLFANDEVEVHVDTANTTDSSFSVYGGGTRVFQITDAGVMSWTSWASRTGYFSVPSSAFRPQNNTQVYNEAGDRLLSTGAGSFHAPVALPHGAVVTRMTFYWDDRNATSDMDCSLVQSLLSTNGTYFMADASSSGWSGEGSSYDDSINSNEATIDNSQYMYYLTVEFPAGGSMWARGVLIEYTYTGPH